MAELPRSQVFCVADVHWQPAAEGDPQATGLFGRFLAELGQRATQGAPCDLYVLGDLFDFWFERRGRPFGFFAPHLRSLQEAVEAGVRVFLLRGNRDFTYESALPDRCGVRVLGDRAAITLAGRAVSLQHGDLLCTRDWRYQLYRRSVRSLPVRLALRGVPMGLAASLIRAMQRASRAEIRRKQPQAMNVCNDAVIAEQRRGFDMVICGHVHRAERRCIDTCQDEVELITLGAWQEQQGWYVAAVGSEVVLEPYCPEA